MKDGIPVLCLSSNPTIGNYRKRILSTRYLVTLIDSLDEMEALPSEQSYAVLIVCNSVERFDRYCVMRAARMLWPWIRVLTVSSPFQPGLKDGADEEVGALAGPFALLASVAALLEPEAPLIPAA